MNIGFLNLNVNSIKTPLNKFQTPVQNFELKKDTFEKSINFKGVNQTNVIWNKSKIRDVYDKTYADVIKQNPIVKELNIEKPEILFTLDEWNNEAIAAYTVLLNAVEVSNGLKEDYYLVTLTDKKGKASSPISFTPESKLELQKMLYVKNPNVKFIKLNDSEKEKFISAVLAHEFRHFIQEHLLLSTQGCEKYQTSVKESAMEAQKTLHQSIEEETAAGLKPNKTDRDYARCLEYAKNYRPKKLLSPDTKLPFSINSKDKKALGVIKHLLPTSDPENRINQINEAYYSQPFEIDAYHYEAEFLNSLIAKKSVFDDSREDVLNAMVKLFDNNARLGIQNMQKYGFESFDKI